jgi:DNA polymerase III delta subunit
MIYAKIENPEQEKRLIDELKISKDKNWYRRLEVISNSIKGVTVEQLSKTFNVSQATADTSMPLIKVDWTFSSQ